MYLLPAIFIRLHLQLIKNEGLQISKNSGSTGIAKHNSVINYKFKLQLAKIHKEFLIKISNIM